MPRFTIDPDAANSVSFPIGLSTGDITKQDWNQVVWYTMRPDVHRNLKAGRNLTNTEIVEEAKRRKFKITGTATYKTIKQS